MVGTEGLMVRLGDGKSYLSKIKGQTLTKSARLLNDLSSTLLSVVQYLGDF